MNFKDKLKGLRAINEETQQDLANYLNVSFQSVSKWEKGVCLPSVEMLIEIAKHYNTTLDSLLLDSEDINQKTELTHIKEYHPTINKDSYFSLYLDKDGLYNAKLTANRHRTDAIHHTWASNYPKNYIIAVNKHGKIIYMALGTGHSMGSPCDPFYHQKEIVEAKQIECFHILDSYTPFGDGTMHYIDWEFVIPEDGMVISIAQNSFELKTMFEIFTNGDNPGWIDFRRFKSSDLDKFTFTYEDGCLSLSYEESKEEILYNSQIITKLFNEYINNHKEEIFSKLINEFKDSLVSEIQAAKDEASEALSIAEDALCTAEDAMSMIEDLENK